MTPENRTPQNTNPDVATPEVSHSGNFTGAPENVVNEFDNTDLSAVAEVHQRDGIPTSPATLLENMPTLDTAPQPTLEKTVEAPTRNRKGKVAAFIAGAALLIGAGGAVAAKIAADGSTSAGPEPQDPKTPSEVQPSASSEPSVEPSGSSEPTAEPSEIPKPTYGEVSDVFSAEKAMNPGEYNGVDKDRQLTYFAEQFDGLDGIKYFANDFYRISENKLDQIPESIDANNTPEEIVTVGTYNLRLPVALKDGNEQQKATISVLEDKSASPEWIMMYENLNNAHKGLTGGQVAFNKMSPMPEVVSSGDLVTESDGTQYRDITIKVSSGDTVTKRFFFHTIQYRDTSFGWWIPQ